MRHASIIGSKGGKFQSIAVGNAKEMQGKYKHDKFQGFSKVYYLDTGGNTRRKKGADSEKTNSILKDKIKK